MDMQRIFEDERRRNGAFARGPQGWAKIAHRRVENARKWTSTILRFSPCSERFWTPTQPRVLMFNRP